MSNTFLSAAEEAAHAAGGLLRSQFGRQLTVDEALAHDIKLELDKRSQALIESLLLSRFPDHAIYGEEGIRGDQGSEYQWVIDPIDGTVNYFYSVPHFAISLALRRHGKILVGVIYDPMRDELWSVADPGSPTLNDQPIHVSDRSQLSDAMVSVGVSKSIDTINSSLPLFEKMVRGARKCRMMGSASLDIAYVACGRLDAYIESAVSLWDVAAGILLVEAAGGVVQLTPHADNPDKYAIVATNGKIPLP
ncbi:MAG: inositol monophosphatase [Chthoniobacterales bacterium]|nr:inositol monophosphatase [Chthoniobacterales bacterium]